MEKNPKRVTKVETFPFGLFNSVFLLFIETCHNIG